MNPPPRGGDDAWRGVKLCHLERLAPLTLVDGLLGDLVLGEELHRDVAPPGPGMVRGAPQQRGEAASFSKVTRCVVCHLVLDGSGLQLPEGAEAEESQAPPSERKHPPPASRVYPKTGNQPGRNTGSGPR